jgi:hypothetical protein
MATKYVIHIAVVYGMQKNTKKDRVEEQFQVVTTDAIKDGKTANRPKAEMEK